MRSGGSFRPSLPADDILAHVCFLFVGSGSLQALGNAFIMQTRVHYAESYPARFGTAMQQKFGVDQSLMQAVGTMLEGCLHTSGFLLQALGAYLAISLKSLAQTKRQ